jgi:hypothetical protein
MLGSPQLSLPEGRAAPSALVSENDEREEMNLSMLSDDELAQIQEDILAESAERSKKRTQQNTEKLLADPVIKAYRDQLLSLREEYEALKPSELTRTVDIRFSLRVPCTPSGDGMRKFLMYGGYSLAYLFDVTAYISVSEADWLDEDLRLELQDHLENLFENISEVELLKLFKDSSQLIDFYTRCRQWYQGFREHCTNDAWNHVVNGFVG